MKITPETPADITALVAHNFRCFGGGRTSNSNPISNALKDTPPSFAAGVDVQQVVDFVLSLAPHVLPKPVKNSGPYDWHD